MRGPSVCDHKDDDALQGGDCRDAKPQHKEGREEDDSHACARLIV